ncbi:MAG: hypothetical protein RLZZ540_273 [Bacteroidota bacterium]
MRKIILVLLFISGFANAQDKITEYKASNNITYKVGDAIQLGRGSGGQGTFVYLKIAGWMAGGTTQIGSAYSGLNVVIKKIKKATFKGAEKVYFTVGGGNITNYSLEIEEAIATCEVKDCQQTQGAVITQSDKFDKLKKLKELLADGTLTQEEYDVEKKKLLNENN